MYSETAVGLILIGIMVLGVGIVMPSEYTVTEEKCTIESDLGCSDQHYYEVEEEKDNTWKPISIGGGVLVAFLGLVFLGESG